MNWATGKEFWLTLEASEYLRPVHICGAPRWRPVNMGHLFNQGVNATIISLLWGVAQARPVWQVLLRPMSLWPINHTQQSSSVVLWPAHFALCLASFLTKEEELFESIIRQPWHLYFNPKFWPSIYYLWNMWNKCKLIRELKVKITYWWKNTNCGFEI